MLLKYTLIPVIIKMCPHVLIFVSGKVKSAVILSQKIVTWLEFWIIKNKGDDILRNMGQKRLLNIQHKSIYQSITFEGDSKILNRLAREELESFEEIESCWLPQWNTLIFLSYW